MLDRIMEIIGIRQKARPVIDCHEAVCHDIPLPEDWRAFHRSNVESLDPKMVAKSVEFLRSWFGELPGEEKEKLADQMKADPQWWTKHHFMGMMAVRNALRRNGFGEKEFKIENLDDYAVGLVEKAFGIE